MEESFDGTDVTIRRATRADIPAIVHLLADAPLGQQRERDQDPPLDAYYDAFARIDGGPRNELIVVEAHAEVVGALQLTLLPYLTYQGGTRAQIEAVRVERPTQRSRISATTIVAITGSPSKPSRPVMRANRCRSCVSIATPGAWIRTGRRRSTHGRIHASCENKRRSAGASHLAK